MLEINIIKKHLAIKEKTQAKYILMILQNKNYKTKGKLKETKNMLVLTHKRRFYQV